MNQIKLNYNVPITESGVFENDFIIQGVAINSVITSNNHKFLAEELKSSATTLNGVPLLVDHDNRVSSIKGRVLMGEFDESNSRVNFKAKVVDNEIKNMIKEGLINSVSVGAAVREIEESEGILIPRGIEFKELSLVAVPADSGATFTKAMSEAYNTLAEKKKEKKEEVKKSEDEEEEEETEEKCDKKKLDKKMEKTEDKIEKEVNDSLNKEVITTSENSELLKGGIKMSEETKQVIAADSNQLKEMLESMKAMKEEIASLKAEKAKAETFKAEVREESVKSKYNIVQCFDGVRGNAFTLVR